MICSVFETYSTRNALFPFSLFFLCTHVHSREHMHLGKDCSRSHITGVTSICSFVGFMENSCFSFMSTYSFHCCSENSYLNGNCNNQCNNNIRAEKTPKHSPAIPLFLLWAIRTIWKDKTQEQELTTPAPVKQQPEVYPSKPLPRTAVNGCKKWTNMNWLETD